MVGSIRKRRTKCDSLVTSLNTEPMRAGLGGAAAGRRWAVPREAARSSAKVGLGADILLIGILIEIRNSILNPWLPASAKVK